MSLTFTVRHGLPVNVHRGLNAGVTHQLLLDGERRPRFIQPGRDGRHYMVAPANFLEWRRQAGVFENLTAVRVQDFSLAADSAVDNVKGVRLSPDFFDVFRVRPAVGRAFQSEEAESERDQVVILGWDFWENRFASDPKVVGRSLRLNGAKVTIVGVMPRSFEFPLTKVQLYLLLIWTAAERQDRRGGNYQVLGCLKWGVSLSEASARLDSLAHFLEQEYPETDKNWGISIESLKARVVGMVGPVLLTIFLGAACVLLLACLNLTNLFGSRAIKRRRETAIRVSLGAGVGRLTRQFFTEGLTIAGIGGLVGVGWGTWALKAFVRLFNNTPYFSLPRRDEIGLDWRVLVFLGFTCCFAAVLFSVAPALLATKTDVLSSLKETSTVRSWRWRATFVAGEVGFSLSLVITAALLTRS